MQDRQQGATKRANTKDADHACPGSALTGPAIDSSIFGVTPPGAPATARNGDYSVRSKESRRMTDASSSARR
jgi:hypothetical protein